MRQQIIYHVDKMHVVVEIVVHVVLQYAKQHVKHIMLLKFLENLLHTKM